MIVSNVICGDEVRIVCGEHTGLIGIVEAKSTDGNLWGSWGDFPVKADMVMIINERDLY